MNAKKPLRIVLADDHAIFREGLRSIMKKEPGFQIVAEASDGGEAIEKINATNPDLVILDIFMPILNGLEAAKKIKAEHPKTKILFLTQSESEENFFAALHAGASGYVVKQSGPDELLHALETARHGKVYMTPAMIQALVKDYLSKKPQGTDSTLTPREREILKKAAQGSTSREIADELKISVKTVHTHRAHIVEKLQFKNRSDLVKYAIRKGIISAEE